MEGKEKASLDMKLLTGGITNVLRGQDHALCGECLTGLLAEDHNAENVDVRVAMVHLALVDELTRSEVCGQCGGRDDLRNPVMRGSRAA